MLHFTEDDRLLFTYSETKQSKGQTGKFSVTSFDENLLNENKDVSPTLPEFP